MTDHILPWPLAVAVRRTTACAVVAGAIALLASMAAADAMAQGVVCPPQVEGRLFVNGFETPLSGNLGESGPFSTGSTSGSVTRGTRVTPWIADFPNGASGARPAVFFVGGVGIPPAAYQSYARHLATYGFVAIRADPPFNFGAPDHVAMALDLRAVIDSLLTPGTLPVAVDATQVAAGGHSIGGKLAVMAASGDPRIDALLLLDPLNLNGNPTNMVPSILPQPMGSIAIPIAIFGELTDTAGAMPCAPAAVNYQVLFNAAAATTRGYEWTIVGAAHLDFVSDPDQCGVNCSFCIAPSAPVAQTRAFTRAASVAFLRTHMTTTQQACEWLTGDSLPGNVMVRQRNLP